MLRREFIAELDAHVADRTRIIDVPGLGGLALGWKFERGGRYGRQLRSAAVSVEWSRSGRSRLVLHPPLLWMHGAAEAVERVLGAWATYAYGMTWSWEACGSLDERVTRIDICRHFQGIEFEFVDKRGFVTRSRPSSRPIVVDGYGERADFTFGAGSAPVRARIYNKSLQLRQRRRPTAHYEVVWNGWTPAEDVVAVEFQHRSDRGLMTFEDIDFTELATLRRTESLDRLWAYDTSAFLSLRVPSSRDRTRSRWPIDARWRAVSATDAVPLHRDPRVVRRRWREEQMDMDDDYLLTALAKVAAHHDMPAEVRDDLSAFEWAMGLARKRGARKLRRNPPRGFLERVRDYRSRYADICTER
jgi:hypothetical protein